MVFIQRNGTNSRKLSYNNKVCVACGICSDCCPTDSLDLSDVLSIARGEIEGDNLIIDEDSCVLCGLCSFACPFGALSFEIDGENTKELSIYPKWTHYSEINEENCEFCGRCMEACPQDTILFKRELPNMNSFLKGEISIKEDKCIYCKVCAELCPVDAINVTMDDKYSYSIDVDEDKCVYCGVCKRACPKDAIKTVCSTCMHSDEFEKVKITGDVFIGDDCISCGWCEEVCPVNVAKVTKPFEGNISTSDKECIACESCVDICSCNAVVLEDGLAKFNQDFCVLCGACAKVCPQERINVNRTSMKLTNVSSTSWKLALDKLLSN